ncbi:arsenate reductase family protein [Marinifilum fragile]|uniref:arsenate reductase family protein n=1 Tax=Marinifilum fragile TaxID=570161 RepID=UPI0006D1CB9A|nr:ArsC/Spx/MgsR family protein [Marinifilum fragile]
MNKIYHLSSCSTCQRILKELNIDSDFELQDIKTQTITADQLEEMKDLSGSYESLFSRRAIKYKELGLKEKVLSEDDYRDYILSEYTFLKRPVLLIDGAIFVGNAKKTVENAKKALGK